MIKKFSILILTSVFVWAREKDNPPAACRELYTMNKGIMGWKKHKKRYFVGCLNRECANGDIKSCEYRDKYYLDYSKNEMPGLYQETSQVKDKFLKLELKGQGHQISKNSGYIPPFNYPGLAIKQSLHNLKFEKHEAKTIYEDLIEKIEGHEEHNHYYWWTPCLTKQGYEENKAKCTSDLQKKFIDYNGLFKSVPSTTQAIIESLKKEEQDPNSITWAMQTIDLINKIKDRNLGIGYEWWLPCAMCQGHPSTEE